MEVKVTLRSILNTEFKPALKRVMSKWPESKDILGFVKIAQAYDKEAETYNESEKTLTEQHGYSYEDSPKMGRAQEITDFLLQKFGHLSEKGELDITRSSEQEKADFLAEKTKADACLKAISDEQSKMLKSEINFPIPRKIKVTQKAFNKGAITAEDCYILEPILDLADVSVPEDALPSKEDAE